MANYGSAAAKQKHKTNTVYKRTLQNKTNVVCIIFKTISFNIKVTYSKKRIWQ